MDEEPSQSLSCPSCAAPLDGSEAREGRITCGYCECDVVVDVLTAKGTLASPPRRSVDRFADGYASRVFVLLLLALTFSYGAALVRVGFLVPRGCSTRDGALALIATAALVAAGALLTVGIGQKVVGLFVLGASGLAFALKPLVVPVVEQEGTLAGLGRDQPLAYFLCGGVLLVLAVLVGRTLRVADRRPRAPRWWLALLVVLGAAASLAYHLQPTRAQLLRAQAERIAALREVLRRAPELPPALEPADPAPRLHEAEPAQDTLGIVSRQAVEARIQDLQGLYYLDYYGGPPNHQYVLGGTGLTRWPDFFNAPAPSDFAAGIERTLALPYVAIYEQQEDFQLEIVVVDVRGERVLARARTRRDGVVWRCVAEALAAREDLRERGWSIELVSP